MGMHILVVDDDPFMREMLPRVLLRAYAPDERPTVTTVGTPEEASRQLDGAADDDETLVVLSDYNLRSIRNGLDVLTEVSARRPDAIRILFSGHTREEIRGIDKADIHDFLEKPFRIQDLIAPFRAAVERALDASRADAPVDTRGEGAHEREHAARSLEGREVVDALLKAASKGEAARVRTLYDEAERRGHHAEASHETIRALAWQNRVLEVVAMGAPLDEALTALALGVEEQIPGMRASVLLLDESGTRLRHGAAPSLPDAFKQGLDGLVVGPNAGSSGTAVHRKERVIVSDIRSDPLWDGLKDLAREHGLVSAWSTPIITPDGRVLGTLALYHEEARVPHARELGLMELASNLARAAIESDQTRRAMHRAQERWRSLYENIPAMYFTLAEDGTILGVNRFGAKQLGYGPEELAGRSLLDILHEDDRARARTAMTELLVSDRSRDHWQMRKRRKDGTIIWVDEFVHLSSDEDGGRVILAACYEMTERKRAEMEREEERDRLRAVLETVPVGVLIFDANGRLIHINRAAKTIWGEAAPLVEGVQEYHRYRGWWADTQEPLQAHEWAAVRAMQTGEPVLGDEVIIDTFDGLRKVAHVSAVPIRDERNAMIGCVVALLDITERKENEAERERLLAREAAALATARTDRERLHNLFMQAPAAIAAVDGPDYVFSFVNPLYETLVGRSADQLLGRPVRDALPEVVEQGFIDLLDRARESGEPFRAFAMPITLGESGDGRTVFLNFVYQPIRNAQGEHISLMAHAVDVTAQVEAQNQMQELAATLEKRVRERTAALEDLNRDLESFSYVVSHDLRAPLRAVHYLVEEVLKQLPYEADDARASLSRALTSAEDMGRMMDGILRFTRSTADELQRKEVDLAAIARRVASELVLVEPDRRVEFVIDPDARAQGDPQLLRVVIENLFGNAWKFTRTNPDARIELASTTEETGTLHTVRDNGLGFDMATAARLFEPFQRLPSALDVPGMGIGLATVRRIIERHGGRIWAEAAPDKGATFFFTLPDRPGGTRSQESSMG